MRVLTIRNLYIRVDAQGTDPIEEAKDVVKRINMLAAKMSGDPVLDWDIGSSLDVEAEYVEDGEE